MPYRSEIVLITFVVILGTLVVQGLTVAPLARLLGLSNEDDSFEQEQRLARERGGAGRHHAGRRGGAGGLGAARRSRARCARTTSIACSASIPTRPWTPSAVPSRPWHSGGSGTRP